RSVVAKNIDKECVLKLLHFSQRLHQAADFVVGVLEEVREVLHLLAEEKLLVSGKGLPGGDLRRPGCQPRSCSYDLHLKLLREDYFPVAVPAHVKTPGIAPAPGERRLVRAVRRSRGEMHEEWTLRRNGFLRSHPGDAIVGQIGREVIAFDRTRRCFHWDGVSE